MTSFIRRWLSGNRPSSEQPFDMLFGTHRGHPSVLIFTEHLNATYFLSFDIPLRAMQKREAVNVAVVSQHLVAASKANCWVKWTERFRPDVVIMSRYALPCGVDILSFFQHKGIPVIYHIDDDLLDLPSSLGMEIIQRQGDPAVVTARSQLLGACNLIYASTACLSERMQCRFPSQRIVHGIYAPYLEQETRIENTSSRSHPVIGYMGSKGHQRDLELTVPALVRLCQERTDLSIDLFGTIGVPPSLQQFGRRIRHLKAIPSYPDFLERLAALDWDIGLAPLVDTPFNRCKAPTKFIEYTSCGIAVAASKIPVYEEVMPCTGGVLVADDWYSAIRRLLDDPEYRAQAVRVSRQHCASAFSVSALERQVTSVLNQAITHQGHSHAG